MTYVVVADTASGKIRGVDVAGIKQFRGIPYGGPASGRNRFMPPVPVSPWSGVRDAFNYGDISPQVFADPAHPFALLIDFDLQCGGMGEDCLNLNVWTPGLRDGAKRPVLVYFHGGGFTSGSGNHYLYIGDRLARFGDVVVVTVNHRLGALGYLDLAGVGAPEEFEHAANAGLLDLVQSLEWVRDNIEGFGGDPASVMIFGQSGGGRKVSLLMAMPRARGLFHRAAIQSGSSVLGGTRQESARLATRLIEQLGLGRDRLTELQRLPFERILDAQAALGTEPGGATEFRPSVDGNIVPQHPFDPVAPAVSADVPLIIGYCLHDLGWRYSDFDLDDAALRNNVEQLLGTENAQRVLDAYLRAYPDYSPFLLRATMLTDQDLLPRVLAQADRKAAQNCAPVWVYRFDWPSPWNGGTFGAVHGMDMSLVFHNTSQPTLGNRPEAKVLADKMASAWVAFARTGEPSTPALPPWQPYTAKRRETLVINAAHQRMVNDPSRTFRMLWNEITGS